MRLLISYLGLIVHISGGLAYMTGVPPVCLGLHIVHDRNVAQKTEVPFKLTFSTTTYTPGQDVNISLESPDSLPFKGFVIYAHRMIGDRERPVGEFVTFPPNKARQVACSGEKMVGLTHKNNNTVTLIDVTWRPPFENVGDIIFKYMVVIDFETFWIDITSDVLPSSKSLVEIPQVEQVKYGTGDINWEACGETKGCFLSPRFCSGSDCKVAATWHPDGDFVHFELFVKDAEYVALGFSDDTIMEKDFVAACTSGDHMSIQNGYNPFAYYVRTYKEGSIYNMSIKTEDGATICRYSRPRVIDEYTIYWGYTAFDLKKDYILFLAWGPLYENTDILNTHIELPVVSDGKANMYTIKIVRGSSLPFTTQIHGILMIIAWMLFVGITTIVSRYYKEFKAESNMFGTKNWFQIHRGSAVIAWFITAASFVIIFVKVKGLSTSAEIHAYLGIALMSACTLQIVCGAARPDLKSRLRPIFNWGHWFLGKSCHLLAVLSFFFLFGKATIIPSYQRNTGLILTTTWFAVQLIWEGFFEFRKCRYRTGNSADGASSSKTTAILTRIDYVLLLLYIILVVAGIFIAMF